MDRRCHASSSMNSGPTFRPPYPRTRSMERCPRFVTRLTCGRWETRKKALRRLESTWASNPASALLASELIRSYAANGDIRAGRGDVEDVSRLRDRRARFHLSRIRWSTSWWRPVNESRARLFAQGKSSPYCSVMTPSTPLSSPRRAKRLPTSRTDTSSAPETRYTPMRVHCFEFAQTKLWLAGEAFRQRQRESNRRVLNEARTLLERVHPARRFADTPCLGLARVGAHPQLAARPGPARSMMPIAERRRTPARRAAIRARVGEGSSRRDDSAARARQSDPAIGEPCYTVSRVGHRVVPMNARMIFFRTGWMNRYRGLDGDDIHGGDAFHPGKTASDNEIFNFQEFNGQIYGYVPVI